MIRICVLFLLVSHTFISCREEKSEIINNGSIKRCTNKYSNFNKGDVNNSNSTLFRGIKFNIQINDFLQLIKCF